MAARIARHRAERPPALDHDRGAASISCRAWRGSGHGDAVVVDCLTLWVANRMLRGDDDDAILDEADALAALVAGRGRSRSPIVSNEVGEGVHPETADGLRFRDLLGTVNQRVAAAADARGADGRGHPARGQRHAAMSLAIPTAPRLR